MSNNQELLAEHKSLLTGRWLTDLANTSAFVFHALPRLNWVGFYLAEADTLWLGPFQGKPACTEIHFSRGVCGKAAREKKSVIVPSVHDFPGHIACDSASQSELVVPLIKNDQVLGVLDLDSPELNRFTPDDLYFTEEVVKQLLSASAPK